MGPGCSICRHPKASDLNARLPTESASARAAELGMSRSGVYRHINAGHHLPKPQEATPLAPGATNGHRNALGLTPAISATLRAVERLARESQRHLKDARKAGDHKATNGAITAAAKALELVGKLRGELQHGTNVNVSVSTTAQAAIDLRSEAEGLDARAVAAEAGRYLAQRLEAGDRDAVRIVGDLLRMLPSAEVAAGSESVPGGTAHNGG